MASCLKYAVLHVCQSKNSQAKEKGKSGTGEFLGGKSHRTMLLRAAVALPDLSP